MSYNDANMFNWNFSNGGASENVNAIDNLGGGAEVLIDITSNTLRARTITGSNGNNVTTTGNLINISNEQIQSLNNTVIYNYLQNINGNLADSYVSPSGITNNAVINGIDGMTQLTLTSVNYVPKPRQKESVYCNFTTTATNGTTSNSIVKFTPNLDYANDYSLDTFLGAGTDGRVYFINMLSQTFSLMTNYSNNTLPITTARYIALDQDDNLLFFTSTDDEILRVYDFQSETINELFNLPTLTAWSGNVTGLYFNQVTHVLTVLDTLGTMFQIPIKPYNQQYGSTVPMGTIVRYDFPLSSTIPINFCMCDETNTPYLAILSGSYEVRQITPLNSPNPAFVYTNTINSENKYFSLGHASSGRLYVIANETTSSKVFRFSYGQDFQQNPSFLFDLGLTLVCITRSPYGIIL